MKEAFLITMLLLCVLSGSGAVPPIVEWVEKRLRRRAKRKQREGLGQ